MLNSNKILFISIILLFLIFVLIIFLPYLNSIILGFVLWFIFRPWFIYLLKIFKNKTITSFLMVFIVLIILIFPFFILGLEIYNQIQNISNFNFLLNLDKYFINNKYLSFLSDFNSDDLIKKINSLLISKSFSFLSKSLDIFGMLFVSLFIFYYLLKQGDNFKKYIFKLIPFNEDIKKKILNNLSIALSSVIYGFLLVALVQGFLVGLGLYFFNVPNYLILGLFAVIASLIPFLGTSIIILPTVFYLFLNNNFLSAAGLLIWGFFIVGMADNFLRPYLIHKKSGINSVFILLSVLGGINYFGLMGFIVGPLIFAILTSLIEIYFEIFDLDKK
ncbi:MAG: AI-2E family transporter [Patescibacteria group bacterium]|nr:AI-2E family transporter [Patescibacteria group bacterium]MDW8279717.1 AI-2E family transporter [bacterium]